MQPAQLRIVHYPHPALHVAATRVDPDDPQVKAVARRMIELMHDARGVGLAAPQVGLSWRLFVANPSNEPGEDRVFINPTLTDASHESRSHEEGCLSLPGITCDILRPTRITVHAIDLDGKSFTLTSDQLPARVWQHEYDHLEGILIIDKMTPMDRMANRKAIRELEDEYQAGVGM